MRFEHLVKINDPLNPLIEPLTREQVWEGLLLRAEQPQVFMSHLEAARIVARGNACLASELDFGSFKVRDRARHGTHATHDHRNGIGGRSRRG